MSFLTLEYSLSSSIFRVGACLATCLGPSGNQSIVIIIMCGLSPLLSVVLASSVFVLPVAFFVYQTMQ